MGRIGVGFVGQRRGDGVRVSVRVRVTVRIRRRMREGVRVRKRIRVGGRTRVRICGSEGVRLGLRFFNKVLQVVNTATQ